VTSPKMLRFVAVIAAFSRVCAEEEALLSNYTPPTSLAGAAFFASFTEDSVADLSSWTVSSDPEFTGEWKLAEYSDPAAFPGDKGLVVSSPARRHAISTIFTQPVNPKGTGLVVQYELQLQKNLECGGAYIKLLTASEELSTDGFKADTPYTIMFGPDKCGTTNKVHFILRHQSPKTGEWEEKHVASPPMIVNDRQTHLYTAIVGADNTVKILIDNEEKTSVSLLKDGDFKPNVNPDKQIDDPDDKKPDDWVDEAQIDDPTASKPDDWDEDAPAKIDDPKSTKPDTWEDDEPLEVPDPDANAPDDWDVDEDGEWEAPIIPNPKCKPAGCGEWKPQQITNPDYKGKWYAPKIDNPEYKGVWAPRKIDNVNFFQDDEPHAMAPIGGVGIELWTMQDGILFDNIIVSTDLAVASSFAADSFTPRTLKERETKKAADMHIERKPGFMGTIVYYVTVLSQFITSNWVQVLVALVSCLVPLIYWCCCRGKKTPIDDDEPAEAAPTAAPASSSVDAPKIEEVSAADAVNPSDEPSAETSAETSAESAGESAAKKSTPRRRTPKAA